MAPTTGRRPRIHIQRTRSYALCGWTANAWIDVYPHMVSEQALCGKCRTAAGLTPVKDQPIQPSDDSTVLGRWEFELMGSPPRPNVTMRGGFGSSVEAMERVRKQRLYLQAEVARWKRRTGEALMASGVPRGLGFVRVSAIFYRANPLAGDEDGDVGALKGVYDAIVRYGCVPDDSRRYMARRIPESLPRPQGQRQNSVRIIIEQLGID